MFSVAKFGHPIEGYTLSGAFIVFQWRIQGGCRWHAPPKGSRFFRFDIQILRNVATSGVGAPLRGWLPPYEKSWIRHCIWTGNARVWHTEHAQ